MDVLVDLLPPSYTAKAEPSAKDNRHKQRQEKPSKNIASKSARADKALAAPINVEAERRTGQDRRLKKTSRGRWLESRNRNDRRRRASEVFVKI